MTTRKPTTKRKPAKRKVRTHEELDRALGVEFVRYKNPTDRVPWWRRAWVAVFGA